MEIEEDEPTYANLITNKPINDLYDMNSMAIGVDFESDNDQKEIPSASTDMGNVSYEVPSIHPIFRIGTDEHVHGRDFTTAAG